MANEELQKELERLGMSISHLTTPTLDDHKKEMLKNSILFSIKNPSEEILPIGLAGIVAYIKKVVENTVLSPSRKALMKERVFAKAENLDQRSFFWSNLFIFNKKLLSSAIILALFFGMFSFVGIDTNVVRAETFSTIDSFSGKVDCERNGKTVSVYNGMYVYENDKILTGADGNAVIRYFDDSVSRLSSNTQIVISKLQKKIVDSYVEVSLLSGEVWAKVVNLVGDNAAFVVHAKDVYAGTKKAAFNVKLQDDAVEVKVFNRSVDVKKDGVSDNLISGQKALVKDNIVVKNLSKAEKSVVWVKDNLQKDKDYLLVTEKRLLVAKMKSMGINSKEDIKLNNSLGEDISVFLSLSDLEKQKKEFELSEKNFIAAQLKLTDPTLTDSDKVEINNAMKGFSTQVEKFYKTVKEVKYTDPKYADELKKYVDDKVLEHKKDLGLVLPDSPVYKAKEVVDQAMLLGTEGKSEMAKEKIAQLSEKVAAAEDVKNSGEAKVAQTVIDNSKQEMKDVETLVNSISEKDSADKQELIGKVGELQNYITNVSKDADVQAKQEQIDILNLALEEDKNSTAITVPAVVEQKYGITVTGDKQLPPGLGD